MDDTLSAIRTTTAFVTAQASSVAINSERLDNLAQHIATGDYGTKIAWDTHHHFFDGGQQTAQYLLVLDALNFCFWPAPSWDYNRLAFALKQCMIAEPHRFEAENLARMLPSDTRTLLGDSDDIPLVEQRTVLLREVGSVLAARWGGQAANLVAAAQGSAAELVRLITAELPGFRDHAIYRGFPVYFYKRAQIAVGDLWGSFGGEGLGYFSDIERLTMFADYRIPQILRAEGVLEYRGLLAADVEIGGVIPAGSEMEIELRAATVTAVEELRDRLVRRGLAYTAIELDWILWNVGEARQHEIAPHHRTLTIYY